MVSQNLQRALQDVRALNLEERKQLLAMLGVQSPPSVPASAEERAQAAMLAKGIIGRIPPPATPADLARYRSITAVVVEGRPVSESLIEDRR